MQLLSPAFTYYTMYMKQIKSTLLHFCPNSFYKMYGDTKFWIRFHFFRKGLISEMFRGLLGYEMDWENPQDLNQKINWQKIYGDTSQWPMLADKYRVREYVKERIGEEALPKLYGVWKNADEIDFDTLPDKFVLKTNQGCGTVLLVKDKSELNISETRKKLNEWVKMKFGYETVEPHYLKIKPVITAEELLENDAEFSRSLVDYKVFCLGGKPYCILVCFDRVLGKHVNLSFYDTEWNQMPDILDGHHKGEAIPVPKPDKLENLLEYSAKLASGHPQVRVDFYIVNNKIYFGEMTFTSQGGYMDYISRKYSLEMGKLVRM